MGPSARGAIGGKAAEAGDERQLLPRYAAGHAESFSELVRRFRAPLYGYIIRCGVPPSAADDLFQEVFFSVHRAAASYRPSQPLKPWLFTITANAVRSHFRKRSVFQRVFSSAEIYEPAAGEPSLQVAREGAELASYLDEHVRALPLKQREVVLLCCIEQLSLEETSSTLQMPLESVKTNLKRGRAALQKALDRLAMREAREAP
jgi:RNA polymerase sigma factor (sigma-70 family)